MATKPRMKQGSPEWYAHLRRAGRKGGLNNFYRNGEAHMAAIGTKGGMKLLTERGIEYYREIGQLGKGQGRKMKGGQ